LATAIVFSRGRRTVDRFVDSAGGVTAETAVNTAQFRLANEASYEFSAGGVVLDPFVSADLVHDMLDRTNDDGLSGEVGGGLRAALPAHALSLSIEGDTTVGVSDFRAYSVRGVLVKGVPAPALGGALQPQLTVGHASGSADLGLALGFASDDGALSLDLDARLRPAGGSSESRGDLGVTGRLAF